MPLPKPLLLTLVILTAIAPASPSKAGPHDQIPLQDLAARYGFPSAHSTGTAVHWKSPYSSLSFRVGSRRLLFNNRIFWLNKAVRKTGKHATLSRADADTVIAPLLRGRTLLKGKGFSMVVLDPGHGGPDSGTIGPRQLYEKHIVLDISKRVKRKLNASNVAVRMTREKDSALTLQQRPRLAASWGADAFISIHANSARNKMAGGIETFVIPAAGFPSTSSNKPDPKAYAGNQNDAANTLLAGLIQQGMLAHTKAPDRGVKRARFSVLRGARCPAVLVEAGFLSNSKEATLLNTASYRDHIAEGIAQGILTYLVRAEASQAP
jgi:N-acetylmuramoyl-L-alanine amidase